MSEPGGTASAPSKLGLDAGVIAACREAARRIAEQVGERIAGRTTVSVERSVPRLLGVDGADALAAPLPNVLVDHVHDRGRLDAGIAHWLGNAMVQTGSTPQQIAEGVSAGQLDLLGLEQADDATIRARVIEETRARLGEIAGRFAEHAQMRERLGDRKDPAIGTQRYVLTATGDVYEDVVYAKAVAQAGGDIVAVIRSTAQSLLDYVPYGPTTEGYGGTFAT
ncbi:MAG: lysine 5,6-aminomutase subunit alpha TIM-barrel domain-containing protein, partial [Solirubrobacteraceae bacterium]